MGKLGARRGEALREPLLQAASGPGSSGKANASVPARGAAAEKVAATTTHTLGFSGGVVNLFKAVIGAGMLSVPRALLLLGTPAFSVGLVLVSFLTVLTIQFGLVFPSILFDRKGTALRLGTYPACVRHWVGSAAEWLLTATMLAGLLLAQASYFDIFSDILVGDASNPGLLATLLQSVCRCRVFSSTEGPAAAVMCTSVANAMSGGASVLGQASWLQLLTNSTSAWRPHQPSDLHGTGLWLSGSPLDLDPLHYLSCGQHGHPPPNSGPGSGAHDGEAWWKALLLDRRVALGLMVLLVLLPLSLKRHMGGTAAINAVGVAALAAFLASVVTLAVAALRAGKAHALPLTPDWDKLTGGGGGGAHNKVGAAGQQVDLASLVKQVASTVGVLSVLLTANSCYSNVHPMLSAVRPFTRRRAGAIVAVTIALTTSFYWAVSACAFLAFGPNIQADVLQNLSPKEMEPLVGPVAAHAMALGVRVAYLISIVASSVLSMFPLRQVLADMVLGSPPQPASWVVVSGPVHKQPAGAGAAAAPHLGRAQSDVMGFAATLSSDDEEEEDGVLQPLTLDEEAGGLGLGGVGRAHVGGARQAQPWPISKQRLQPIAARRQTHPGHSDPTSDEEQGCLSPVVALPASLGAHLLACSTSATTTSVVPVLQTQGMAALRGDAQLASGLEQLQLLHASTAHEAEVALAQAVERHAAWRSALHVPLTLGSTALIFVLAVAVPNIWMVMSLLGSLSASIVSFVMPALVGLFALEPLRLIDVGRTAGLRGVLYLTIVLGLLIFAQPWVTFALA